MAKSKRSPEQPKPWERQKGEEHEAFAAFCEYRDMGKDGARRSQHKVGEKLGKSDTLIERWAKKYSWTARVNAWDDELDRQTREELIKGIAGMRKNHVGIAQAMLAKALKALQRIPEDELTPQDVARMVDIASKLERISRGESTERTEGTHTVAGDVRTEAVLDINHYNLAGLTDEELSELDEITSKLAAE